MHQVNFHQQGTFPRPCHRVSRPAVGTSCPHRCERPASPSLFIGRVVQHCLTVAICTYVARHALFCGLLLSAFGALPVRARPRRLGTVVMAGVTLPCKWAWLPRPRPAQGPSTQPRVLGRLLECCHTALGRDSAGSFLAARSQHHQPKNSSCYIGRCGRRFSGGLVVCERPGAHARAEPLLGQCPQPLSRPAPHRRPG